MDGPIGRPVDATGHRHDFVVPVPMGIFLACAAAFFGMASVSTPSFSSEWTCSASISAGSVKARVKLPYERSYV
jgi:hypothetical protein